MGDGTMNTIKLAAVICASVSLAMTLCGVIVPRFFYSSRSVTGSFTIGGVTYTGSAEDFKLGVGLAAQKYKIEVTTTGSSAETEEWVTTLDESCDEDDGIAEESCCKSRKAAFSFAVIGMVAQLANIACIFLIEMSILWAGTAAIVMVCYCIVWAAPVGACDLDDLNARFNAYLNTLFGTSGLEYLDAKLETSFILFMLSWGLCLVVLAIAIMLVLGMIGDSTEQEPAKQAEQMVQQPVQEKPADAQL